MRNKESPNVGLALHDVGVSYGKAGDRRNHNRADPGVFAIRGISFSAAPGEFVSLLGASGCGKTTILNVLAGVRSPTVGQVLAGDRIVEGPGRDRAVVFQSAALLPWRTVLGNVAYGAELQHLWTRAERRQRAIDSLRLVGLDHVAHSYPHHLSGGMQQRVNLARALVIEPEILLLDEPFAALDAYSREILQEEMEATCAKVSVTAVLVTHQANEAVYLSDRVLLMAGGPGRIVSSVTIDAPRPRGPRFRHSPQAISAEQEISEVLRSENAAMWSSSRRIGAASL